MHKLSLLLIGFFFLYSSGVSNGLQLHVTKKHTARNSIKTNIADADTLAQGCPFIATKYVEWAKHRVMSLFNEPRYQESVTNLGLDTITADQVTLVTDPHKCEGIKGYVEKWLQPPSHFKKVFLKVSDYYLIVFVPENVTGPNSVTGLGSKPIHLLTEDFKIKTGWLY